MIEYKFLNIDEFEEKCDEIFEFFNETIGDFYQNLHEWYYNKVCLGFSEDTRKIIAVLDENKTVIGVSILKTTKEERKICSFKVRKINRCNYIGGNLLNFSLNYFNSIGETNASIYVPILENDLETTSKMCNFLNISQDFSPIKIIRRPEDSNKLEILFRQNGNIDPPFKDQILMSIKKKYADQIIQGTKKVEFRRKPIPGDVKSIIINSTGISSGSVISGLFDIGGVIKDTPENLWNRFKDVGGINKSAYDEYFSGCSTGYAILVENVVKIGIESSYLLGDLRSPQFYRYLK